MPTKKWTVSAFAGDDDVISFVMAFSPSKPETLSRLIELGLMSKAVKALLIHANTRLSEILSAANITSVATRLAIAEILRKEGAITQAREQLQIVVNTNPTDVTLVHTLAELSMECNDWLHAAKSYEHILAVRPDDYRSKQQLGIVYAQIGSLDDSVAMLKELHDT